MDDDKKLNIITDAFHQYWEALTEATATSKLGLRELRKSLAT